MKLPRSRAALGALMLVGLLGLTFSAPALAKKRDRLKLTAPATAIAGEGFTVHMTGFSVKPANLVTEYESKADCAVAFHPANAIAGTGGGSLQLHPGRHGKSFSFTFEPTEQTPGLYHICAYLIYGHKTYARATGKTDVQAL
jgi:hypothetical protein